MSLRQRYIADSAPVTPFTKDASVNWRPSSAGTRRSQYDTAWALARSRGCGDVATYRHGTYRELPEFGGRDKRLSSASFLVQCPVDSFTQNRSGERLVYYPIFILTSLGYLHDTTFSDI